ncbi:ComEC/Rec2 family competence protein, partial [Brachyspira hyodysenteriae]|uniref:ComEC/Rec2 family competence protein n=1 Tax=Brachyspira hyodysenteriae TaxID=159 RepID=UPI0015C4AEBE
VLAYALLMVVVLDPWAVLAPGFCLSFGAVAVMAYAFGGRLGKASWLVAAIQTQWAVTLGLVPFLLVLFQQVSIISPVANAFAIPVVSLLVVPFALLGA